MSWRVFVPLIIEIILIRKWDFSKNFLGIKWNVMYFIISTKHRYDDFHKVLEHVNELRNKQASIKFFNSLLNFPFSSVVAIYHMTRISAQMCHFWCARNISVLGKYYFLMSKDTLSVLYIPGIFHRYVHTKVWHVSESHLS